MGGKRPWVLKETRMRHGEGFGGRHDKGEIMLLYYNLKNQRKQIKLNVLIIVSRLMWRRGAWMAELHQVMGI